MAMRAMRAMVPIARAMERICPDAVLLNYTNPMHKVCDAITTLSKTQCVGLCHGVWMGMEQVAYILDKPVHEMEMEACGINHFSWFQTIRDRRTGDDLYPQLRAAEREGSWLADWHEIGLGRILLRRFGLYPSPASNHVGDLYQRRHPDLRVARKGPGIAGEELHAPEFRCHPRGGDDQRQCRARGCDEPSVADRKCHVLGGRHERGHA